MKKFLIATHILYLLNTDLNLVTCSNLYKQYTLTPSQILGSALEFNNGCTTSQSPLSDAKCRAVC